MRTLFSIFVLSILATTSFSEEMCLRIDGCWVDTKPAMSRLCETSFPEVIFSTSGTLYVCEDVLKACASAGFNNCVARHNDCLLANEENENGKS